MELRVEIVKELAWSFALCANDTDHAGGPADPTIIPDAMAASRASVGYVPGRGEIIGPTQRDCCHAAKASTSRLFLNVWPAAIV